MRILRRTFLAGLGSLAAATQAAAAHESKWAFVVHDGEAWHDAMGNLVCGPVYNTTFIGRTGRVEPAEEIKDARFRSLGIARCNAACA